MRSNKPGTRPRNSQPRMAPRRRRRRMGSQQHSRGRHQGVGGLRMERLTSKWGLLRGLGTAAGVPL